MPPSLSGETSSAWNRARELFHRAYFQDALDILADIPTPKSAALRIRALSYLGRSPEATDLYEAFRDRPGAFEACLGSLASVDYAMQGRMEEAHAALAYHPIPDKQKNPVAAAERRYALAVLHLIEGDLQNAEIESIPMYGVNPQLDATARAFFAFLEARRKRPESQATAVKRVIEDCLAHPQIERKRLIAALDEIGVIARDTAIAIDVPRYLNLALDLDYGPHNQAIRQQTLRSFGWRLALSGEFFAGLKALRKSGEITEEPAWRLQTKLDCARIAFATGETVSAELEIADALEIARDLDWTKVSGAQYLSIAAEAAELLAPYDLGVAKRCYRAWRATNLGWRSSAAGDERPRVWSLCALGAICTASGASGAALLAYERAYELSMKLGLTWRAAASALSIAQLLSSAEWRTKAMQATAPFPNSFVAREIARCEAGSEDPLACLTPKQRRVFMCIAEGRSSEEAARELGCSLNTVRSHRNIVYRVMGLSSKAELVDYARVHRLVG